ncbi:hypothetical protein ABS71_19900 [bacterium SCN 62-11]|nr:hypothetical protein [Candidatus Eremiobacteraeota bacterium]ODT57473.1 MAG: hypothetical protein ABS71_19900 [bacterium SCN 62-11]
MRVSFPLFLLVLLSLAAAAQDQNSFLETLPPGRAAVFRQAITIEATPSWWVYLNQNSRSFAPGLAGGLVRLAKNMNLGVNPAGWEGRISVNLKFPPTINDDISRQKILVNLNYVPQPMVNPGYCLPRAGRFLMNVSFDPRSTILAGNVSQDGGVYNLVSPIYATLYTSDLQEFFKKGL